MENCVVPICPFDKSGTIKDVVVPKDVFDKTIKELLGEWNYLKFYNHAKSSLKDDDPRGYLACACACEWWYGCCLAVELPSCFPQKPEAVNENCFTNRSFEYLELARFDKRYAINSVINVGGWLNEVSMEGSCD